MKADTDIDIDVADRSVVLSGLKHVPAMIDSKHGIDKHKTGVYFQNMPYDPVNDIATIDHKDAEELGYFKIDFLNVHFYEDIADEEHLNKLLARTPDWTMLENEKIVEQLFHISSYYDLCSKMKPRSIPQLAMLLAIIRPAKKHLQYKSWEEVEKTVWDKPSNGGYYFKKSHSYSYAVAIAVQMNLIEEQMLKKSI